MKIEPRSDFRQAAQMAYELYAAMVDAGFTKPEAMQVVIALLAKGNS